MKRSPIRMLRGASAAGRAVLPAAVLLLALTAAAAAHHRKAAYDATAETMNLIRAMKVGPNDWPQWGGSYLRNNTPEGTNIARQWNPETGENIRWIAQLGSQTYGNPVIANGKVFVGTNNGAGYNPRYPSKVDLGVLLCFTEKDGKFLWQHSSEKLPTGRVHDWENQGICSTVYVDGDRLWFVTSRGEVRCLDTEGFHDKENDGEFQAEYVAEGAKEPSLIEADVVWSYDMMKNLKVSQHNMCSCSVTIAGDFLFVCTGNGVDESHKELPQPSAPSFLCMDKNTGKVHWTDNSPGRNVLHGQWSSPAYGVFDGQAQVLFAGGDGWLYSFDPAGNGPGNAKLLWKFDCNPKESIYKLYKATRNHLIGTPLIYDGLVYIAVGEDPEHAEGEGHLWCIDPTKRGDVSPELVFNKSNPDVPIAHKRLQACNPMAGDFTRPNPNSAAVWHYVGENTKKFESTMHRTCGTAAIKDDLLYIADFSGLFHCIDAKTGKAYWTHDFLDACWGSPLIVDGHVYVGDEGGDVFIFKHGKEKELVDEINMGSSVYSTPVVANGTLFISNKDQLFAIEPGAKTEPKASTARDAE